MPLISHARFWPVLTVLLSLGYTCANGPFRAPDEYSHFFRAYEISEGRFVASTPRAGFLGDQMPASLEKVARIVGGFPKVPPLRMDPAVLDPAFRVQLKSSRTNFLLFPGAALHSPLMYLPAAAGILVGRALGLNPLALLYLARCANALGAGALLGWAAGRVARPAPFLPAIALLPMTLYQVGNVTADALTFAIVLAWLAEVLHARASADSSQTSQRPVSLWRWIFFSIGLSQLRFPYPLLGLFIFALPPPALGRNRRFSLGIFFALLIIPSLVWDTIAQGLRVQMRPLVVVDPAAQLLSVFHHPFHFLEMVGSGLARLGPEYWREATGVFGWLQMPLPVWLLGGITAILALTICGCDAKALGLTTTARALTFTLSAFCLFLTALLVYLAWNAVGAPLIEGWQGRYAIPLLPFLALALANSSLRRITWLHPAALAGALAANVFAIIFLARATYFS